MPIALDKMPVVDGGRVDVSAPNESGLNTLARSLDVIVRGTAEIGLQAQVNEFQNVKSLLDDATIGPDEAKEIAGNAFFPINRFAAQNRAGEAKVHAIRDTIEEDLLQAVDSIDARQRLRKHQQALMDSETELGVQAGIRQAIADMAGPLINDASKKRIELRNINRRNDEAFILSETLVNDPDKFVPELQAILSDQYMDATQAPDVHKTAGQTLLNMLIENPASAPFVKQAATEVLEGNVAVGSEDRAQYTGVLKAVSVLENASNADSTAKKARLRDRSIYGTRLLELNRIGAGASPEARNYERLYESTFDDPLAAAAKIRTLKESGRQMPIGMIDTDPYRAGYASVKAQLSSSAFVSEESMIYGTTTPQEAEVATAAFEIYDAIMGSLDPEAVRISGDGHSQAQQAAELAISKAKEYVKDRRASPETDAKLKASLEMQQEAAVQAQDWDEMMRLNAEIENIDKSQGLRRRRALLDGYNQEAKAMGISVLDLRQ